MSTSIELFYAVTQLRKLHKQFDHPSKTKLFDLLKTAGVQVVSRKTLENQEYLVSIYEPYQKIRTALNDTILPYELRIPDSMLKYTLTLCTLKETLNYV